MRVSALLAVMKLVPTVVVRSLPKANLLISTGLSTSVVAIPDKDMLFAAPTTFAAAKTIPFSADIETLVLVPDESEASSSTRTRGEFETTR
jgi:hypothetical protein